MRRNETHQTTYMQAMGMCLVEDDVSSSGKQALVSLLPLTSQDVQHTFSHDVCLDMMYRRPGPKVVASSEQGYGVVKVVGCLLEVWGSQIINDDVYPATMYRHPGIFLKCGVPNNRHQRIKYILGRRLLPCDNISMSSEQDLWAADLIPLRMVLPSKMSGFALPQHIDIWEPMGLEHSGKCGAQRYSDVRDASSENGLRKLLYWPQGQ
ncbi:hypothetical protein IW262DRAFT_1300968 [Armillaria fumosa]|nr:hypothetical protein IW262DRAFT_1300968 [Armillaria fumosa]